MKKEPAPFLVWAPPGSPPLVSPGIEVRTIGEQPSPEGGDPAAEPEETGGGPDETLAVPPETEAMAQRVMARYDMKVSAMQLITTKPDKGGAIWRIETNRGPRSLKLLHRPLARSLFSIGAQEYLHGRGARVPALIQSKDGLPYVDADGHVWIVTEWIESLRPASKTGLEGATTLCFGLGEFHKHSHGYVPPQGAQRASRLYRWPKTYEKTLTKIGWFRILGEAYAEMPAASTLRSAVSRFEAQARQAVEMLQRSPYGKLIARGESHWGIAHQDERSGRETETLGDPAAEMRCTKMPLTL